MAFISTITILCHLASHYKSVRAHLLKFAILHSCIAKMVKYNIEKNYCNLFVALERIYSEINEQFLKF